MFHVNRCRLFYKVMVSKAINDSIITVQCKAN